MADRQGNRQNVCAQVLALPGIGRALADKICEIMATGTLRKATAMAGDERVQALQIFTNIWGVGPTTARQWYDAGECVCVCVCGLCTGHRTLDDVRASVTLTRQQEIGMKYVDELDKRMPRAEATQIVAKVRARAPSANVHSLAIHAGGRSHARTVARRRVHGVR